MFTFTWPALLRNGINQWGLLQCMDSVPNKSKVNELDLYNLFLSANLKNIVFLFYFVTIAILAKLQVSIAYLWKQSKCWTALFKILSEFPVFYSLSSHPTKYSVPLSQSFIVTTREIIWGSKKDTVCLSAEEKNPSAFKCQQYWF